MQKIKIIAVFVHLVCFSCSSSEKEVHEVQDASRICDSPIRNTRVSEPCECPSMYCCGTYVYYCTGSGWDPIYDAPCSDPEFRNPPACPWYKPND